MIDVLILEELGWIVVAAAAILLVTRPFRVPPILAYMAAGLILGPATGLLGHSESIDLFSELGIALLLFVVGLELSLDALRDVGRAAIVTGVVQVGLIFALGSGLGLLFGLPAGASMIVGLVCAFSSTVVVVKLLDASGDLHALHGRLSVGILLVQDVLVALTLTLLSGMAGGGDDDVVAGLLGALGGIAALTAGAVVAIRWVLPAFFRWIARSVEALFIVSLTWAFAFILAAEALHVSVEMGAFIAGVALAQLPFNDELRRRVHPLVDFFLAVFFVALGAGMEPAAMAAHWPLALAVTTLVLTVKPVAVALLLGAQRESPRTGFLTGLTLGQTSEFSFILTPLAVTAGLVEPDFMGLVGLAGLLSMGVSAVLVPRSRKLADVAERRGLLELLPGRPRPEAHPPERGGHVVVVGMNTLGRLLVERFVELGEEVLAVDIDPAKLVGLPSDTFVGNVDGTAVVEEAGIPRAKLVVSTLQIEDTNSLLAYRCRRLDVPVSIHAFDPSLTHELLEMGVDHVMISKLDGIRDLESALREAGVMGGQD